MPASVTFHMTVPTELGPAALPHVEPFVSELVDLGRREQLARVVQDFGSHAVRAGPVRPGVVAKVPRPLSVKRTAGSDKFSD
jgi:hypothetical protein